MVTVKELLRSPALLFLLLSFSWLLQAWRWHLLLQRQGASVHFLASLRVTLLSQVAALGAGVGGADLARFHFYRRWFGVCPRALALALGQDRLLGLGAWGCLVLITVVLFGPPRWPGLPALLPSLALHPSLWLLPGAFLLGSCLTLLRALRSRPPLPPASGPTPWGRAAALSLAAQGLQYALVAAGFYLALPEISSWHRTDPFWISGGSAFLGPFGTMAGFREAGLLPLAQVSGWLGVLWLPALAGVLAFCGREPGRQRRAATGTGRGTASISVVIPTRNEAGSLPATLEALERIPEIMEIIVVDGGSTDSTCNLSQAHGCTVYRSEPGRGRQLRLGASHATGDVVLLLHADTQLPPESGRAIFDALRDRTVVGGGLWKVFGEKRLLLRGSRFKCLVRLLLGGRLMGDQALFVRRTVLEAVGGVPDQPLMEEFELCRRLNCQGRLALADAVCVTSARRFLQHGILRTYWLMWRVMIGYYRGRSPGELRRLYERG